MSTETNKAIVRRLYDQVWKGRRPDLLEEFYVEDVVHHEQLAPGMEGLKQFYSMSLQAFSDFQIAIEDAIAEGDQVVIRWTMKGTHQGELLGIPPTGVQVTQTGATIFRLAGARIAEAWYFADNLSLMQQMGVIPMDAA